MSSLRKIASFVRWRLVPVRYATMLGSLRWSKVLRNPPSRMASIHEIEQKGYTAGPTVPPEMLQRILDIYQPRAQFVKPKPGGHPFVNLFQAEDISPDNPVFQFTFSPEVLDAATDYFGGKIILDSIQVLYSWPTEGQLRESQYWHLDYGDRKSFHCVAYLKDVLTPEDGPFVYVDKDTTKKIGRSMIVRRIPDQQFDDELINGKKEYFYAKAGTSVLVDPSACYHYGSRCKTPRIAIFATFSSYFPFAQPIPLISQNAAKIVAAAQAVRPDLSKPFINALLQVD